MRSESEINELLGRITEQLEEGSKFPGMSYEEGVQAAIDWITEETDSDPLAD